MKVNTITRTVKVTISRKQLLDLFVNAVYGDAKAATDKDQTFYRALGYLIGIKDVDAVKTANSTVPSAHRITTEEFRCWLPTVFAEFALMLETSNVG